MVTSGAGTTAADLFRVNATCGSLKASRENKPSEEPVGEQKEGNNKDPGEPFGVVKTGLGLPRALARSSRWATANPRLES